VQLVPGTIVGVVLPQPFTSRLKFSVSDRRIPVTLRSSVPVLDMVISSGSDEVPTATSPNSIFIGDAYKV